jgi:[NiFe] hydrogenase diaphorase moiety large subunit
MTLCARIIGAELGFIYLRAEYLYLLEKLQAVLAQRRQLGLLGQGILGHEDFNFDIEIHLGAGAYICGEESALIESLLGRRGIPRVRPPFPVQSGYMNWPTVVDNVESFWSASRIAIEGADWFRGAGTPQSAGSRLISISGDCSRPGIYEYPFGTPVSQVLDECGGKDAQAVQVSGAAGHMVWPQDFNRCLGFEDLPTGGSFMVFGPQRNLMEVLQNFAAFFHHESCGYCTPCRNGTRLLVDMIDRFRAGRARWPDIDRLRHLLDLMKKSSFCGLGCSVPTAFLDALDHKPALFERLIESDDSNPAFDLDGALTESRALLPQRGGEGSMHG